MKKRNIIFATLFFALLFIGCKEDSSMVVANNSLQKTETQLIEDAIENLPMSDLTSAEEEGLIYMREEEKLARDVYLHFSDKYGVRIFSNIAKSESVHMAALKMLLDKYNLEDPILDDAVGSFQNEKLAGLYTQLTEAGDVSLVEALKIGLTIEDLDIYDLMEFTDNVNAESKDIIFVYNNLTRGSRNHLRAYNRLTLRNGGTYQAQFITQDLFNTIISASHEHERGSHERGRGR